MKLGQWIGLLALITSFYILWQIRDLLLLLFTAVVLAVAINKLVDRFQHSGVKRIWGVWLSLGIIITLLTGVFLLILPQFVRQVQELFSLLPTGINQMNKSIEWLQTRLTGWNIEIPDINGIISQIQPLANNFIAQIYTLFSTSITVLLQVLLVLVLTIMLLINPQPYRRGFVRCFPSFYRYRVEEILTKCREGLGSWTIGALIEMLFIAILSGVGLWVLGVPLALAHAVLAGLLNFIPNIGPTLSAVFPMTVAFLDEPWKVIAVLILYVIIQNVESYWLTPTVMAKQVALLPAITLTSQLFFTTFFGALGLLMALPLTVVAKIWIEESLFKDVLDRWENLPSRFK
ncbi:MAG: AI-2E family transporter [Calothrix sp. C42_A2020_038]|nr:AI-2E family transporter [Calothrix sp. C42_A2020_038]